MRTIVIGGGYFGTNYIRELGGHLVGVVEPDQSRANLVAKRFNTKVWPNIPTQIDYDAAIIATPPDTHISLAKAVLETGRYCLIEKPLGISVEECLQINKYKNKVMSGLIYLYHPELEKMNEWLKGNRPNHVFTRRTNDGPVRIWQDALWDLASHDISIINYLAGHSPVDLSCYKERDFAVLNLEYLNFTSVTYVSWVGGPKTRLVELVSTPERYVFDDMKSALEISPLRRMLDDFLTGEWNSKSSFEAGLEVVNVLEKASQS